MLRALDASASLDVMWGGRGDLSRLLDADHAQLMQIWTRLHTEAGWKAWAEATFNIYGERGSIDLLAFHPATGVLEVAEGKTGIWDVQDTLARLDTKIRLATRVAAQRGWRVRRVVGALVIAEGRTARRRVADHDELFARYDTRGGLARAFIRDPGTPAVALLVFVSLPRTNRGGLRRAGQLRVRIGVGDLSVAAARSPAPRRLQAG